MLRGARPCSVLRRRLFSTRPAPPVLDLSLPFEVSAEQVAGACSRWGFFQVINHGVDQELLAAFRHQMAAFFALPQHAKDRLRRSGDNARGFFDDELTKQRRDEKEAIDIGVPGSSDWSLPDGHPSNACLDGFNRLPDEATLPGFRSTIVPYFEALTGTAERVAGLMEVGLDMPAGYFDSVLRERHTSYLRLNYFPPVAEPDPGALGISPHRDAGFLTVLAQDDACHSLEAWDREEHRWIGVTPVPGALTINTGDMAQIWSNDRYYAPEHRVLTHPSLPRYSAPFFYNPGYDTRVAPLPSLGQPAFSECCWGYYRAQRFAGDFADWRVPEIQVSDFAAASASPHVEQQKRFVQGADFSQPFSVDVHRPLLEMRAV